MLDIFFEALNYEAIEQKKAYDLAGLLGDSPHLPLGPQGADLWVPAQEGIGLAGGETAWGRSWPQPGSKVACCWLSPVPHVPCSLRPAAPAPVTALSPIVQQPWHCPQPRWPTLGSQQAAQQLLLTIPSSSPGDIGGQMGLFIGASILTILEILDYVYEVR